MLAINRENNKPRKKVWTKKIFFKTKYGWKHHCRRLERRSLGTFVLHHCPFFYRERWTKYPDSSNNTTSFQWYFLLSLPFFFIPFSCTVPFSFLLVSRFFDWCYFWEAHGICAYLVYNFAKRSITNPLIPFLSMGDETMLFRTPSFLVVSTLHQTMLQFHKKNLNTKRLKQTLTGLSLSNSESLSVMQMGNFQSRVERGTLI